MSAAIGKTYRLAADVPVKQQPPFAPVLKAGTVVRVVAEAPDGCLACQVRQHIGWWGDVLFAIPVDQLTEAAEMSIEITKFGSTFYSPDGVQWLRVRPDIAAADPDAVERALEALDGIEREP